MKKNEKGPENCTMAKLCPARHTDVTAQRLCPLNETATVCFTQHSQSHPITQSLFLLLLFNTKAPYLHTLSEFYHRELNSLREMSNLSYIQPFLALLIVHYTEGKIIVRI